jgi:hypothetical protein
MPTTITAVAPSTLPGLRRMPSPKIVARTGVFLAALSLAAVGESRAQVVALQTSTTSNYVQSGAGSLAPGFATGGQRPADNLPFHLGLQANYLSGAQPLTDPVPTVRLTREDILGNFRDTPTQSLSLLPGYNLGAGTATYLLDKGYATFAERSQFAPFTPVNELPAAPSGNDVFKFSYQLSGSPVTADFTSFARDPSFMPQLSLSGGAWNGGAYQIQQNQALGILSNAFSSFNSFNDLMPPSSSRSMSLRLTDDASPGTSLFSLSRTRFGQDAPLADFFSSQLPAFSLMAGHSYTLSTEFIAFNDLSANFSGIDVDIETVTTQLTIQALTSPVPEPETYALLLAGLGLMGFHARRRKPSANPSKDIG